jgi:hypothetical protein
MKLDHLKLIGKFEFSNSCALWAIKLTLLFLELIGAELDYTSKRESVPHNMFYKCTNLQKFLSLESICFKGPNRALWTHFQTRQISRRWLNV